MFCCCFNALKLSLSFVKKKNPKNPRKAFMRPQNNNHHIKDSNVHRLKKLSPNKGFRVFF